MNVIFTCGGTGGHINPAIAVANILKERHPDCNILFIGGKGQMEEELVPKAGFELKTLPASGLCRKISWDGLKRNVRAVKRILGGVGVCKKIIKEFGADVVIGTGGYVSFNAIMAARMLKIPTCVHESNAMPGLTTRLVADMVDSVLICFPESAKHYRHPEKAEVVGMPVRREFIFTKKEDARKELGLDERDFPYAVIVPAAILGDYKPLDPAKPSIPADIAAGHKIYGPVVAAAVEGVENAGVNLWKVTVNTGSAAAETVTPCQNLHAGDLVAYNTKTNTVCTLV